MDAKRIGIKGIILFVGILILFLIFRMSATPSELTNFEGWYMHAYQYKYPELETYMHVDDGKWTLLIKGEIAAQGKYVEQQEDEWHKQVDPWKSTQYKYDFISEEGVPYSCFFEIEHGWRRESKGKMSLDYKNEADRKPVEQTEEWESFLLSSFVRINEPKI